MEIAQLDIDRIHHAFSPAREICDPHLFVGRQQEIEAGLGSLMNRGGFMAIIGPRGVGKSTLGCQIKLIAEGETALPHMIGLDRLLPRRGFEYHVHYVKCDGFVHNIPDLLKRICFGDDHNPSLFSITRSGEKRLKEFRRTVNAEGGGNFLGIKMGGSGEWERTYEPYVSDDLIQQFRGLLRNVRKDIHVMKHGLLILIDEFDTIPDKTGFASLVKACSSDFVKFGVIGIASSITELIEEHSSIGRQVDIINVPLMPRYELYNILRKAEHVVGHAIVFQEDAKDVITERSEGFPYFTHLLGKEAMLSAFIRNSTHISAEDIEVVAGKITSGRLGTIYEDLYHTALQHCEQKEVLLKILAEQDEEAFFVTPLLAMANELGLDAPESLLREFADPSHSHAVLAPVRDGYYRFTDPVFKVYARMRQWRF